MSSAMEPLCAHVSKRFLQALLRGQTPVRLSGLRMEETLKRWSKTPAGLCVSTWIRAGMYAEILVVGGSFSFESYINLTAVLSSQNSSWPDSFARRLSTLDALYGTFEASIFFGWLIELRPTKLGLKRLIFNISSWTDGFCFQLTCPAHRFVVHVMFRQELNGKSGFCRLPHVWQILKRGKDLGVGTPKAWRLCIL